MSKHIDFKNYADDFPDEGQLVESMRDLFLTGIRAIAIIIMLVIGIIKLFGG